MYSSRWRWCHGGALGGALSGALGGAGGVIKST